MESGGNVVRKILISIFMLTSLFASSVVQAVEQPKMKATVMPDNFVGIRGIVKETMNSGGYTYINASDIHNNFYWLATPEIQISVGDEIEFPDIPPLSNFQSKTLNKTFEKVSFIPGLRKLNSKHVTNITLCNSLFEEENFKQAYTSCLDAAEKNNAEAQKLLGLLYINGKGVSANYKEGMKWFRLSAEQGVNKIKNDADVIAWYLKEVDENNYDKAIEIIDNIQNKNKPDVTLSKKKIDILKSKMFKVFYSKVERSVEESTTYFNLINDEYMLLIKYDAKNSTLYGDLGHLYERFISNILRMSSKIDIDGNYECSTSIIKFANSGISYLSKAIALNPNESIYFNTRAEIYELINRKDDAINDYTKAINLKPNESLYYSSRSNLYSGKKIYKKAISDISYAIKNSSDLSDELGLSMRASFYASRAILYELTYDYVNALSDYKYACKIREEEGYCGKIDKIAKNVARGKKWVKYDGSDDVQYYYDKTSIVKSKNISKLWVRKEQSPSEMQDRMKASGNSESKVSQYEFYSHTMINYSLDCKNREIGVISLNHYDSNGSILDSYKMEKIEMDSISPDSNGEALFKIICK